MEGCVGSGNNMAKYVSIGGCGGVDFTDVYVSTIAMIIVGGIFNSNAIVFTNDNLNPMIPVGCVGV